jgi:CDGSH-type Zn-finger protein
MVAISNDPPVGPAVSVTPNGPYVVAGDVPVVRRHIVMSEHGEPLTYETTARLETGPRYALCRCGQSGRKPFCDGTHARIGFDGAEAAPASTYDERQRTYMATGVVVRDDRSICSHAGFCGNRVTNVWKQLKEDATEDSIARAQVMAMVERCPSGALTYRLESERADIEPELAAEIAVLDNGPLFLMGRLPLTRTDGTPAEPRNRVTLCRCGSSANKPYCDGSHRDVHFADAG